MPLQAAVLQICDAAKNEIARETLNQVRRTLVCWLMYVTIVNSRRVDDVSRAMLRVIVKRLSYVAVGLAARC
ncbi:MAG: hypothetical protein KDB23_04705 [Planctomycetales bacterium]|nr:hypothetical protein [Planctomycetales bacterium]